MTSVAWKTPSAHVVTPRWRRLKMKWVAGRQSRESGPRLKVALRNRKARVALARVK